MIASQRETSVRTLRVRSNQQDQLALQNRLARSLWKLDLAPPGLPPTAILCIRELSDPAPGKLSADEMHLLAHYVWGQAIRGRIASIAGRAARPALGIVPANSEAVLFADHSELLACVAEDWCAGRIAERWWWQSIYDGTDAARIAAVAWLEAPEHAPPALDLLARRRQAVPFLRRLPDRDVRCMQEALIEAFGLYELHSVLYEGDQSGKTPTTRPNANLVTSEAALDQQGNSGPADRAPWQRSAPEFAGGDLDSDRQCLLGIGLSLQRDPALARSHSFAREAGLWYRMHLNEKAGSPGKVLPLAEDEIRSPDGKNGPMMPGRDIGRGGSSIPPLPQSGIGAPDRRPRHRTDLGHVKSESKVLGPESETPPATTSRNDSLSADSIPPLSGSRDERLAEDGSHLSSSNDLQPAIPLEGNIRTELGGLFYLINLALHLDLYADFTKPLEPGISLPVWDFVALVGRRLLGDRQPDDPVWGLLARLAGRPEDVPPGEHFEPLDEWRLPADWLKPFAGQSAWKWSADRERLRVRHPEGFYVLDVRIRGKRRNQLLTETEAYTRVVDFRLRRERRGVKKAPPLERWMNWLVPFISARLRRALGLNREEDLAEVLFKCRAHIEASRSRLDIFFTLSDLPISIRLAGLDRDPGWVPAAGRFVAFHFQ